MMGLDQKSPLQVGDIQRHACAQVPTPGTQTANVVLSFRNGKKKNKLFSLLLSAESIEFYHSKDASIPSSDTPSILNVTHEFSHSYSFSL